MRIDGDAHSGNHPGLGSTVFKEDVNGRQGASTKVLLLVVDAHGDDEIVQLSVGKFLSQMQCIVKVSAREAF